MAAQYKLFDFLNDLNFGKKNILREDYLAHKDYSPFIINIGMSLHVSSILDANEMNMRHQLPKQMHYDYFINVLNKQKRFGAWPKKPKSDKIQLIKSFYKVNTNRAIEYSELLPESAYAIMTAKMSKGGQISR